MPAGARSTTQLMQKPFRALGPEEERWEKKIIALLKRRNKKYIEKIVGDQYSIWTPRLD